MPLKNVSFATTLLLTLSLVACSTPATTDGPPDAAPPDTASASIDLCKGIDCGPGKCGVQYGRAICKCNAGFSNFSESTRRCEACVPLPNPINVELPAVPVKLILTNPDGQPLEGAVWLLGEGPDLASGSLFTSAPQLVRPGKYSVSVSLGFLKSAAFARFKGYISVGQVENTADTKELRFTVPKPVPIEGRLPLKVGSIVFTDYTGSAYNLETAFSVSTSDKDRFGPLRA